MKVTKAGGRGMRKVIVSSGKGKTMSSFVVPGQGEMYVVKRGTLDSAKNAASHRLARAVRNARTGQFVTVKGD